jgi:pyridoxine kinase
VFGDHGKLYVPAELVEIYRNDVIPLANIVTPNQFEAEQLTGIAIESLEDAKRAIDALHDLGPELVVMTSFVLKGQDDKMYILASQRDKKGDNKKESEGELWCVESPVLPGTYTGTGDLTAALLLAWTAKDPNNLGKILERVVSTMYTVIKTTQKESNGTVAGKELQLIRSKEVIETPPELFKATQLFK